jgi:3',5'-cyclic AMP phosphodiesterase CpdA
MERRTFLASTMAALVAAGLPQVGAAPGAHRRALRLAYLTDMHVEPGLRPEAGFAQSLEAVAALPDPVDLLVNGGDAVFSALARDATDVAAQFRTFRRILDAGPRLPVMHCIGNHDVWGWGLGNPPDYTLSDPRYGKGWALDALELESPYYQVDRGHWRFIVLDSTYPGASFDYQARLDDAQFSWLEGVLTSTPVTTPVCLISHIPLVSVAARHWFGAEPSGVERGVIEEVLVHRDAGRVVALLEDHPGVKLALSGHLHMEERIEFRGVTYLNVGAVSGNWWNAETPDFRGFGPSFATVDLFDDGSFSMERHSLAHS